MSDPVGDGGGKDLSLNCPEILSSSGDLVLEAVCTRDELIILFTLPQYNRFLAFARTFAEISIDQLFFP